MKSPFLLVPLLVLPLAFVEGQVQEIEVIFNPENTFAFGGPCGQKIEVPAGGQYSHHATTIFEERHDREIGASGAREFAEDLAGLHKPLALERVEILDCYRSSSYPRRGTVSTWPVSEPMLRVSSWRRWYPFVAPDQMSPIDPIRKTPAL